MAGTVNNPQTPYVGPISLQVGSQIHIQGVPEQHHTHFIIALQSGPSINPRSDTPFVFNPRFNENQVVRNTQSGNSWGNEERHGGFPFQQRQKCNVRVLVKSDQYEVFVNGQHFTNYRHRTPISKVTHLIVEGGIRITQIRFESPSLYPGSAMSYPSQPAPISYPGSPIYNPPTPFVQSIPGGIHPGKLIFISGIPSPNPTRFSVYLQTGMNYEPSHIGLVFDARFNFNADRNVVVRNHREHGQWGSEERAVSHFPFFPNAPFEMIIMAEGHQFKVAVNNQHFLEFRHRLQPLSRIDTLRIDGSVTLTQIRFQ
ncbi:hypothetical protein CHS0354_032552 [Potamilus streckersoni]|uniref:Galectin n=1 Tax=Potamilus streckersoni TaxID=2493646 RepID=A0AAE0SQP9_9BIVA|nr:hypothetical protein CHS0354_032552 [Potamilus streckersoni]